MPPESESYARRVEDSDDILVSVAAASISANSREVTSSEFSVKRPGTLFRSHSLAQLAREHKRQSIEANDTRKFFEQHGSYSDESELALESLFSTHSRPQSRLHSRSHSRSLSRSSSLSGSRSQSRTCLGSHSASLAPSGTGSPSPENLLDLAHDSSQIAKTESRLEERSIMFRTGSRMFSQSEFELGIGGEFLEARQAMYESRHVRLPPHSYPSSRSHSRRGSFQAFDAPKALPDMDSEPDLYDSSSSEDTDAWTALAESKVIDWVDWALGLGGPDSLSGIREFLSESNRPVTLAEKRRVRERSILTDPAFLIAIATALMPPTYDLFSQ